MIVVTTHKNTDFDGLASVIAATLLYPGAVGVVPKMVNKNVEQFLSTHKTAFNIVLPGEVNPDDIDTLVTVDTGSWKRLDRMDKLRHRTDLTIHVWDHHRQGDMAPHWQCLEDTGATVSLLIREMRRRSMTLSPLDSTVLLIGLYEDTGHLSYPSTTSLDAEAAAFLLSNGADLNVAAFFLNPPYEEAQRDLLFDLLQNSEMISHRKATIGLNIIRLKKKVPMLSSVVTTYRKLINCEAVFVICVNNETSCTIIGRSASDRIDVGAVLDHFGGGGHSRAASATIKADDCDPYKLKKQLVLRLRENKTTQATIFDLMSYPVTMVPADTPMKEVRGIMEEKAIRGILVGTEENLEGIVVLWDFKKIRKERQWRQPVKAFMIRKVTTVSPDMAPSEAAQLMVRKNIGHLPVAHEGRIIGILTRTDILTYFYDMLPE